MLKYVIQADEHTSKNKDGLADCLMTDCSLLWHSLITL